MKKLVILLVIVVLAFAGFLTWLSYQPDSHMALTNEEAPAFDGAMSEEAAAEAVRGLDYEAIEALHAKDEIIMNINGQDVSWEEYYSWLYMNGMQVEVFFEQMALYYGVAADWEGSVGDGSGMTYAQLPTSAAEETLVRIICIEQMAAEKGIELSEESLAALEDKALAEAVAGEGATLEQLMEVLEQSNMSLDTYKRISRANYLYSDILAEEFGKEGEKLSDEEVGAWLADQGYMAANHILLMTNDKTTGETVDEATAAEKKAKADEIYAELSAIEDIEERVARFKELKEEFDEDTGKTYYPDGYTFTSGTMVSEFEGAVNSLEDYQLSEPVKSSYGWHVIMRMPLGADNSMSDSSGALVPASWLYAQQTLGAELDELMLSASKEYSEGFEVPQLVNYIK